MIPIHFRFFAFLILLSFVWGCSEKLPDGIPPLHPCRIVITQDGKPLEGASLQLYSTGGSKWHSSGTTDSSGAADIVTQGQYRGVPEGTYKITVQKEEVISLATPEELAAIEKAKAENPQWFDAPRIKQEHWQLVEKEYTLENSTSLEITISQGKNSETFDVGKAVREKIATAE